MNLGGDIKVTWKNDKVSKLKELYSGEGEFLLKKNTSAVILEFTEIHFEVVKPNQEVSELYICKSSEL